MAGDESMATPKVIATFYPSSKLTILTLNFITISSVVLFNFCFTLYGASELRMGGRHIESK